MSETVSINDKEKKCEFVVKKEFLDLLPLKPEKILAYDLYTKYNMMKYLHNPIGPAIITLPFKSYSGEGYGPMYAFFIDGKELTLDEAKALKLHLNLKNETK